MPRLKGMLAAVSTHHNPMLGTPNRRWFCEMWSSKPVRFTALGGSIVCSVTPDAVLERRGDMRCRRRAAIGAMLHNSRLHGLTGATCVHEHVPVAARTAA